MKTILVQSFSLHPCYSYYFVCSVFIYLFIFLILGNVYRSYQGLRIRYYNSCFRKNVKWLAIWHVVNFGFVVTALQIFPGNIKAYYRQVLALKAQSRLTDALTVAEKGMEIKPGVSSLLFVLIFLSVYDWNCCLVRSHTLLSSYFYCVVRLMTLITQTVLVFI